jgi:hypothetical protein
MKKPNDTFRDMSQDFIDEVTPNEGHQESFALGLKEALRAIAHDDRRDSVLSVAPTLLRHYSWFLRHDGGFGDEDPAVFEKVADLLDAFNTWRILCILPVQPETVSLNDELTNAWKALDFSRVMALTRQVPGSEREIIEKIVAGAARDVQSAEERDWVRDELNVQATAEIDRVSEAELVAPRLPLSGKASFIWRALRELTTQGVIFSHQNVQQWLTLNTLGVTVSPRHYRRIKRLFCERSGLAG